MAPNAVHGTCRAVLMLSVVAVAGLLCLPAMAHHDHATLSNAQRGELDVDLRVGTRIGRLLPLHISVLDPGLGRETGFGVKVFVDEVRVLDETTATETEQWVAVDIKRIGYGYHYLLINVCDHHDHIGVDSVWVKLDSDGGVTLFGQTPAELIKMWKDGNSDWPGKLTSRPTGPDPTVGGAALRCCGTLADWPTGAQDSDKFKVK